ENGVTSGENTAKNEDKEMVLFAIAFSCLGVCNRSVSLVMRIVVGMYKQELYKVAPFDGSFQIIV
ncbi:hypothetical protein, partial [Hoylesella shahii]|uniref:hypothetical protein n=1 Tax=Hoylesella shahii TaxID=228603 RepID=UPI00288ABF61